MTIWSRRRFAALMAAAAGPQAAAARASALPPPRLASIGAGLQLHYAELGQGPPVVFVHGSLSDYTYWSEQAPAFAASRRAIALSRRYDWPNSNPPRPGYSAVADADDLAAFIEALSLGPVHLVGHSYGALAGLFLAIRRPRLVRTLALAEPPAVSLLADLPGTQRAKGQAMLADIERRMVAPMAAAFAAGDSEEGVRVFIDYVLGQGAWESFSAADKVQSLRSAREWTVIFAGGRLFPPISRAAIAAIAAPVLLMSGERSYPFLRLIDAELGRLMPGARRLTIAGAGHQMWLQAPDLCRDAVLSLQASAPA